MTLVDVDNGNEESQEKDGSNNDENDNEKRNVTATVVFRFVIDRWEASGRRRYVVCKQGCDFIGLCIYQSANKNLQSRRSIMI